MPRGIFLIFADYVTLPALATPLLYPTFSFKGARTSNGACAAPIARDISQKLATVLQQRPTERPMPLQHAAAN